MKHKYAHWHFDLKYIFLVFKEHKWKHRIIDRSHHIYKYSLVTSNYSPGSIVALHMAKVVLLGSCRNFVFMSYVR